MKVMRNILVTGVGGGVGESVLKALEDTPYGIVGVDSEELAAGLHAVNKAYKGFYASDPRFIDRLMEICRNEECGLIFAGHDVELPLLSQHLQRFRSEGIVPVVSSEEVIRTCYDKMATQEFLKAHGFPVLETKRLSEVKSFHRPVVLKPQWGGARSRNTYVARSSKELSIYRELVDPENCIVQEYIEGDEYTCGSVTLDNKCLGVIVMRRILRDGDTYKAFVEYPSPLESFVRSVVEALKPFGACNIQLRVRNGEPFVFEINARCSGTTASRALAGFNEPKIIADYLYNKTVPEYTIREISILRYWKELIEQLRKTRFLSGDGTQL
jgi:carbamoyl-phosphate synthase large subunit